MASAWVAGLPALLIALAVQAETPVVSVTIRTHQFVRASIGRG
jgi:hypothetical protein